ncbi:hypothetical protein L5I01_17550 [Gordonia sp. HY442]|uniref:hypothetical protein n=1 Tax=Gordonia zhenghanii TaxID=2911516 RepID=UPI001F26AA41|nr:hypothetical protein [Gordonia zhenghanii]MCF8605162.1 hypothetical protein [Gordonia zhenghanii]
MFGLDYIVVGVSGFVLGMIAEWGILKVKGHRVTLPFISSTSRNFTIMAILLAVISLGTIYNVEKTSSAAADCNRQFREALAYNTAVARETRDVQDRARSITTERRQLLDSTFTKVALALDDPTRPNAAAEAIKEYVEQSGQLTKRYDDLTAYQQTLDKDRRAYPEPNCGLS